MGLRTGSAGERSGVREAGDRRNRSSNGGDQETMVSRIGGNSKDSSPWARVSIGKSLGF